MHDKHQKYIKEAISLAIENAKSGDGGPFGALVVLDGKVVGRGSNQVTSSNDPTAHAEMVAIRDACRKTGSFKLENAVIYTSCEPCPMCLSAIYWARIKTIYFAAINTDAAKAGFDDSFIYQQIPVPVDQRAVPGIRLQSDDYFEPFRIWMESEDKVDY